jgi:hypothetical protein
MPETQVGGSWLEGSPGQKVLDSIWKITKTEKAWGTTWVGEWLPSKYKTLS